MTMTLTAALLFYRRLLTATLQLLIALSIHKTSILLHKLDVNLLGAPASQKGATSLSLEYIRLPTLTPMLLPRNQVLKTSCRLCITTGINSVDRI